MHCGLSEKLKDFLIELGRDFCFVGSEYPLQVGGQDFALDLLFFHRGLTSLVAVELKVGRFQPEYLGKLAFYLEALDRDVRKPHEQPSIGVLLCASKDDEVVEYALSRTLSPTLIAQYQTQLPDKSFGRTSTNSTFRTRPKRSATALLRIVNTGYGRRSYRSLFANDAGSAASRFAFDNDCAAVIIANAPALPRTSPHFFALLPVTLTKRFLAYRTLCSGALGFRSPFDTRLSISP